MSPKEEAMQVVEASRRLVDETHNSLVQLRAGQEYTHELIERAQGRIDASFQALNRISSRHL